MKGQEPKIVLESFDDMLNFETKKPSSEVGGILEMSFDRMESFPEHKFKLYEGQQLEDMVLSIRLYGILMPFILWHTNDDRYIILSGHNRANAAKIAGLSKGPVMIKENLTFDDAALIVSETNLRQRSFTDLSHSERAYCLAQHYKAMKSQGKRTDILQEIDSLLNTYQNTANTTSSEVQTKLRSDEKLGKDYGLSRDKVAKYIRISNLLPSMLTRLDDGNIAFLAAYELTFIENQEMQQQIVDFLEYDGYKLDMKKAHLLREYYESKKLNEDTILQILTGEKNRNPNTAKPKPVKLKPAVISKYFSEKQSPKEIEAVIEKALAMYFEKA